MMKSSDKKEKMNYYQYFLNKSINFRYKMPQQKGLNTFFKWFTDFNDVTFDQKDLPIILLD